MVDRSRLPRHLVDTSIHGYHSTSSFALSEGSPPHPPRSSFVLRAQRSLPASSSEVLLRYLEPLLRALFPFGLLVYSHDHLFACRAPPSPPVRTTPSTPPSKSFDSPSSLNIHRRGINTSSRSSLSLSLLLHQSNPKNCSTRHSLLSSAGSEVSTRTRLCRGPVLGPIRSSFAAPRRRSNSPRTFPSHLVFDPCLSPPSASPLLWQQNVLSCHIIRLIHLDTRVHHAPLGTSS